MARQMADLENTLLTCFFILLVMPGRAVGSVPPVCVNGVDCTCPKGYELVANRCEDVDECSFQNGRCQQSCVNSIGSYKCECQIGYQLANDNHRCDDINECAVNNGDCSSRQLCINTWGGRHCAGPYVDKANSPEAQRSSYLLNTDVMVGLTIWLVLLTVLCIATVSVIVTRSSDTEDDASSKDRDSSKNPEYFSSDFWPRISVTESTGKRSEMGEIHPVHY